MQRKTENPSPLIISEKIYLGGKEKSTSKTFILETMHHNEYKYEYSKLFIIKAILSNNKGNASYQQLFEKSHQVMRWHKEDIKKSLLKKEMEKIIQTVLCTFNKLTSFMFSQRLTQLLLQIWFQINRKKLYYAEGKYSSPRSWCFRCCCQDFGCLVLFFVCLFLKRKYTDLVQPWVPVKH